MWLSEKPGLKACSQPKGTEILSFLNMVSESINIRLGQEGCLNRFIVHVEPVTEN